MIGGYDAEFVSAHVMLMLVIVIIIVVLKQTLLMTVTQVRKFYRNDEPLSGSLLR